MTEIEAKEARRSLRIVVQDDRKVFENLLEDLERIACPIILNAIRKRIQIIHTALSTNPI